MVLRPGSLRGWSGLKSDSTRCELPGSRVRSTWSLGQPNAHELLFSRVAARLSGTPRRCYSTGRQSRAVPSGIDAPPSPRSRS